MSGVARSSYIVEVRKGTGHVTEHTDDVVDAHLHEEVERDGERVIVVNSQPSSTERELPPRGMRSLGSVAAHATSPVSGGEGRPRRGGRRGNPMVSMLATAVPLVLAAWAITFLDDRVPILVATGALVLVWLLGIAAAWRGLGPGARDSGGTWLGRAIGLVLGALVAVYLLLDTVTPLL